MAATLTAIRGRCGPGALGAYPAVVLLAAAAGVAAPHVPAAAVLAVVAAGVLGGAVLDGRSAGAARPG